MCSEMNWRTDRWTDLISMVEYALNTSDSSTLGVSPVECHMGYEPRKTIRMMAVHGATMKEVEQRLPTSDLVKKHLKHTR